jgi:hypothetical protein
MTKEKDDNNVVLITLDAALGSMAHDVLCDDSDDEDAYYMNDDSFDHFSSDDDFDGPDSEESNVLDDEETAEPNFCNECWTLDCCEEHQQR